VNFLSYYRMNSFLSYYYCSICWEKNNSGSDCWAVNSWNYFYSVNWAVNSWNYSCWVHWVLSSWNCFGSEKKTCNNRNCFLNCSGVNNSE
jgi:hypothetical protein